MRVVQHHLIFALTLMLWSINSFGQGLVQSSGHIVLNNSPYLVVDGNDGNYFSTSNGKIDILDNGEIHIPGNWTNVSGEGVFTTNFGQVQLTGGLQTIDGTDVTLFPSLQLSGSDDKSLNINALVGGGHSGGGTGQLECNGQFLRLNTYTLIVNNSSPTAITQTGGGIISETDPTTGYGPVQWNIRNTVGFYTIPFAAVSKQAVPYSFDLRAPGVNTLDSGFIVASTYPTDPSLSPNNRVLPTSITNTWNEYGRENAANLADRFWIIASAGYSTSPIGIGSFGYLESEWDASNGSTNDITESNLKPIQWTARINSPIREWNYPGSGATNGNTNTSMSTSGPFDGIWVLADTTICPVANFVWDGNCEFEPIEFTDMTTMSKGAIEIREWDFGNGIKEITTNPVHPFTPGATYNVRLIAIGSTGCPDTLTRPVVIDSKAIADFTFDNDPLVDIPVQFNEQSQNSDDWNWDFGDTWMDVGPDPKHTYDRQGIFDVTLIANNPGNCPDTITKQIEVNLPSLFLVPTAFSPGGKDDLNKDIGLSTLQQITDYHFTVYNRWGEKIFESDKIEDRWDGTYLGKPAMAGSYLYMMSFRDRTERKRVLNGSLLLLR